MTAGLGRHWLVETLLVFAVASVLGLAVNALSPAGIAVTHPLALKDLDPRYITVEEARTLFDSGQCVFLDARKPDDYAKGHVAGAINYPAEQFVALYAKLEALLAAAPTLVIYCGGSDCGLSRMLANRLGEVGFKRVKILHGGWQEWKARGGPVE